MDGLLTNDHSELDSLFDELFAALETNGVEPVFQKLDLFWARLAMHIRAEHLHLFPAILGAIQPRRESFNENRFAAPSVENARKAIEQLRDDHDFFMRELAAAIKLMREMRQKKSQAEPERLVVVREKVTEIRRRLERHNELEESEVYQWAETLLDSSERMDLNGRMQKELDNLPPRFGYL